MQKSTRPGPARLGTIVATVALGASALFAPVAANADSATTAASVKPTPGTSSCQVTMRGVSSTQRIVSYTYSSENGKATLYTSKDESGQVGFVPKAFAKKESKGSGSPDALGPTGNDYYAIAPDGNLWLIGVNHDGSLVQKKVNSTWGGVRSITAVPAISGTPGANLFALTTAGGLNRYTIPAGPTAPTGTTVISSSGWQNIKTLSYSHSVILPSQDAGDVFIATAKDGRLIEYTFPRKTPAKWTSKVVAASSWQNITSMAIGSCLGDAQAWIGTLSNGDAYLYYDKNSATPLQSDLAGLGRIATGWTPNTFSGWSM